MRPSISFVLFGIALAVSLSMLALLAFSYHTEGRRDAAERRFQQAAELDTALDEIDLHLEQARRIEMEFLVDADEDKLAIHAQELVDLSQSMTRAQTLMAEIGTMEEERELLAFLADLTATYGTVFSDIIESTRRLGLDPESGLQGELRGAIHTVEASLEQIGNPAMQSKMLMMRRHEKDFMLRGTPEYLDELNARVAEFRAFPVTNFSSLAQRSAVLGQLDAYQTAFAAFVDETLAGQGLRQDITDRHAEVKPVLESLKDTLHGHIMAIRDAADAELAFAKSTQIGVTAVLTTLFMLCGGIVAIGISRPLRAISRALDGMRSGDFDRPLIASRIRESAAIGAAVGLFRSEQQQREAFMRELARVIESCAAGDFSQRLPEAEAAGPLADLARGVNAIGEAAQGGLGDVQRVLRALAEGDLTVTMPAGHVGVFQEISVQIAALTANLVEVLRHLAISSRTLNHTAHEIAAAMEDSSMRGQSSAAAVEESAAALKMLTDTLRDATATARCAEAAVADVEARAQSSRVVADQVMGAIHRIEESSRAIGKITDLIGTIAFQTNLLALNAGVEAARAGEAGRGFAVVASEVRALAQSTAKAAAEITAQIRASETQVADGVRLVMDSVSVLGQIETAVADVVVKVGEIIAHTQSQATSIDEIAGAVGSIDGDMQRNTAVLDQTSTSGRGLNGQADLLVRLVDRFRLPDEAAAPLQSAAA
ncbi:methyl-accepting chemotaxis protein [Rhodobacter sp. Har01]|uniref:methyl-accepting chemotaxis protein n=1 Tax=Rhodobacter sp. Har01 TaxID=2883999 RepID=UPI001D08B304|nr:methyl-accepting chemotaxis protein [Rhodobacter sp. Har01]MCB6178391.1 methyl-accepting chemotaxis protein [Rhodobacter sp. Har01]